MFYAYCMIGCLYNYFYFMVMYNVFLKKSNLDLKDKNNTRQYKSAPPP